MRDDIIDKSAFRQPAYTDTPRADTPPPPFHATPRSLRHFCHFTSPRHAYADAATIDAAAFAEKRHYTRHADDTPHLRLLMMIAVAIDIDYCLIIADTLYCLPPLSLFSITPPPPSPYFHHLPCRAVYAIFFAMLIAMPDDFRRLPRAITPLTELPPCHAAFMLRSYVAGYAMPLIYATPLTPCRHAVVLPALYAAMPCRFYALLRSHTLPLFTLRFAILPPRHSIVTCAARLLSRVASPLFLCRFFAMPAAICRCFRCHSRYAYD